MVEKTTIQVSPEVRQQVKIFAVNNGFKTISDALEHLLRDKNG